MAQNQFENISYFFHPDIEVIWNSCEVADKVFRIRSWV